jgi:hypothetical protein
VTPAPGLICFSHWRCNGKFVSTLACNALASLPAVIAAFAPAPQYGYKED